MNNDQIVKRLDEIKTRLAEVAANRTRLPIEFALTEAVREEVDRLVEEQQRLFAMLGRGADKGAK